MYVFVCFISVLYACSFVMCCSCVMSNNKDLLSYIILKVHKNEKYIRMCRNAYNYLVELNTESESDR